MQSVESRARISKVFLVLCATLSLAACGGDEESTASPAPGGNSPGGNPPAGNGAPVVTGVPPGSTLFGRQYTYTPSVVDPDGDSLTFSINAVPTWATFDTATGRLHGTPSAGDVGLTPSMTISVSDGTRTSSIGPFSINVVATASGAATLSWAPPTQNSDGSPLTNLSSYRIYFGTSEDELTNSMAVANPGIATLVVEQLTPATWYFGVTAVNAAGVESTLSNIGGKTVL
jgi:hypothetical protein